jgi:hypothetical protein
MVYLGLGATAMTTLVTNSTEAAPLNDREAQETESEALTEDEIFHVLQNQRRRLVLRYLEGRDDPVRMGDVAEQVAAWEHDTTVQALNSTQRQRVYIPLYQNHLTKLDDKGIIDYNQSRGIVERKPAADQLQPYIDPFEPESAPVQEPEEEFPWELPYAGIACLGTLFVVGQTWNLPVATTVPEVLPGIALLVLFTVTSLLQVASEQPFRS